MTDTDLLPCPWCGGEDQLTVDLIAGDDWSVECERCHVGQHAIWPSKYHAIAKWNTRTPSSTRANERGDFDWAEMQRYLEEGADEPDWDASWVIDRVRTCIAANTPQPSPQSDMVEVPREVIQTLFNVHCNLRDDIGFQINIGSRPHGYQTEGYEQAWAKVFELLQPYTKGE